MGNILEPIKTTSYFRGATPSQINKVVSEWAKSLENSGNPRLAFDAGIAIDSIFNRFWESVETGKPVDISDWELNLDEFKEAE